MITVDDAKKVARLARLQLDDEQTARFARDLDAVVGYVDALKDVDVEGVTPMSHPFDQTLRRRDDVATDVAGRRAVQGSAGYTDGLVRVPKIIE